MVSYPCGPPSLLDTGMSVVSFGNALGVSAVRLTRPGRGRGIESRERAFLESPPRLAKDPALMVRADITAPVFNDEEKRTRATPQVHKVARDGYRCDVGTVAFWARCDRATTLVAGARHGGTSSARNVPAQPRRFAPSCGGAAGQLSGRSRGKRSLSSAVRGYTRSPEASIPRSGAVGTRGG